MIPSRRFALAGAVFASAAAAVASSIALAHRFKESPPTAARSSSAVFSAMLPRKGRWIEIDEDSARSVWVDSVTVTGARTDTVSAWLLWSYASERTAENGRPYRDTKQLVTVACSGRKLQLGVNYAYGEKGSVVYKGSGTDSLEVAIPETTGESIVDAFCTGYSPDNPFAKPTRR